MNLVDSCGWLEYFADGPNAGFFADALEATSQLLVPTICLYEVFKRLAQQRGQTTALSAVACMRQATVVELDGDLAVASARLALQQRLPMADSIVLATARKHRATLLTQDEDFQGLPDVRFVRRK